MHHPGDLTLIRAAEDPSAVPTTVLTHLDNCRRCQRQSQSLKNHPTASRPRRRPWGRGGYVALVVGLGVVAGGSIWPLKVSRAAGLLDVFSPTRMVPVTVARPTSPLPELSQFGTLQMVSPQVRHTGHVSQAQHWAGFSIALPQWRPPAAAQMSAHFTVAQLSTTRFTFQRTAVQQANHAGAAIPALPAGLNGTTITMAPQTAVVIGYGSVGTSPSARAPRAVPQLAIFEGARPQFLAHGSSWPMVDQYLAKLPGVPTALVKFLLNPSEASHSVPVPIPSGAGQAIRVNGRKGVEVTHGHETLIVWQHHGVIYGVAGQASASQILHVAQSLR